MTIQLSIITPDETFWDEPVDEMIIPTNTGDMGVLPNHADLITSIDIGRMKVYSEGKPICMFLGNGFAAIRKNRVIILVNEALPKEAIDPVQADKDLKDTLEALSVATDKKSIIEADLAFKRATARYLVSKFDD